MLNRFVAAVRRNHALEHATIAVLMRRLGPNTRMVGRATPSGFYIYGDMPEGSVEESAREGLARLKNGESGLAVSALCGTNLAVAGVMAGLAALIASGGRNRWERMPTTLLSSMLAVLAAQPVGRWLQKNLTTSADVSGLEITGVRHAGQGVRHYHKVETSQG
ncbi:MAG: DUF6391 domain-containing protein [Dehalococcoidia bacterium]|nr:DUF6391 domain-containing protein [Dehalococcoidia bacterium]